MSRTNLYWCDALQGCLDCEAESVDAIVTDPPYGLGFMGKNWDHGVPGVPFWEAVLRAAKPGAHLLAFGGTRTHHRLMCAIEDAGWEIRDCLMWVYGSGFPKSLDVGKAIDKAARQGYVEAAIRLGMPMPDKSKWDWTKGGHAPGDKWWRRFKEHLSQEQWGTVEREVVAKGFRVRGESVYASGFPSDGEYAVTAPATPAAKDWDGWGTALKPAWEPIILARKPLAGTVAANVLEHGTGGLNIDGCRIGTGKRNYKGSGAQPHKLNAHGPGDTGIGYMDGSGKDNEYTVTGRWPANVVHDGSEEVVEHFPQQSGGGTPPRRFADKTRNTFGEFQGNECPPGIGASSGSAARFFYCAKASRSERGKDNTHPTVKPVALMRWLCRLVTPPNGLILDPFCGSGTTGVAAVLEGFRFIGIDDDPDYYEIAHKRIAAASAQPDMFHGEPSELEA